MFGLTALWAAVKGLPIYIIIGLLALCGAGYAYYSVKTSRLETSLAQTQNKLGAALQSNKSLEFEIAKRQKEFEASEKEREAIQNNDAALAEQARKARQEAETLAKKRDAIREIDPDEFLRQINEETNCLFEGFGNSPVCDKIVTPQPEKK